MEKKNKKDKKEERKEKEYVKIVKASEKGLDYLHFSLIFLVIILIGVVFFLSANQKIYFEQRPIHSKEEIKNFSLRVIASYFYSNYSFIPFISSPSLNESFLNGTWIVEANVSNNKLIIFINDKNLSVDRIFFSSELPKVKVHEVKLVANGVIELPYTKCNESYWFLDAYSINSLTTLNYSKPNIKFIFIFTKDSLLNYPTYGIAKTQLFVKYLYCAYKQNKLQTFVNSLKNLGIIISPKAFPVSEEVLKQASFLSALNISTLNSCLNYSTQELNNQALLANFYNITSSPLVLIDCKYLTIPQHIDDALAYTKAKI
ncbi:MAG: hypothetical protein ACP5HJ_01575 [Candidatus Micrarchaeia archaeon]